MKFLYVEATGTDLLRSHYQELLNEAVSPGNSITIENLSGASKDPAGEAPVLPTFWGEGINLLGEMFRLIEEGKERYDATIIGCSADPGLRLAKRRGGKMPVIGPFESALHLAAGIGGRLAIFTPGPIEEVRWLYDNARFLGLSHLIADIQRVPVHRPEELDAKSVHQLSPEQARDSLLASFQDSVDNQLPQLIETAVQTHEVNMVYFSCTFWGGMLAPLAKQFPIHVIDPLLAPVRFTEAVLGGRVSAH
jgi:Asp/Glu/hydantoin racemase